MTTTTYSGAAFFFSHTRSVIETYGAMPVGLQVVIRPQVSPEPNGQMDPERLAELFEDGHDHDDIDL